MMQCRQYIVSRNDDAVRLYFRQGFGLTSGSQFASHEAVYLISSGETGFFVAEGRIIAIVIVRPHAGRFYFQDIVSRKIYSSDPRRIDESRNLVADRDKVAGWELFDLVECPFSQDWARNYVGLLDKGIGPVLDEFLAREGNFDSTFLKQMVALHGAGSVAEHLVKSRDRELLLRLFEARLKDLRLTAELIRFHLDRRDGDPPATIGKDMDWLSSPSHANSPDGILNTAIRRTIPSRGKSCIVATARNEGVYLIEWIAYHLELGFEKIFLYTNNNTDGSTELIRELHACGVVEMVESDVGDGANAQGKAYVHALRVHSGVLEFDWCALIDVDEFLVFNTDKFRDVNDFLRWHDPLASNVIALNWILMSNNVRDDRWIEEPVTSRITRTSPFQSHLIKCISRPKEMHSSGPHYPIANSQVPLAKLNADRERYAYSRLDNPFDITVAAQPVHTSAFIYHFELKSLPELLWKYSRNRGNHQSQTADIQFNPHLPARLAHFRKCIASEAGDVANYPIDPTRLAKRTDEILGLGKVRHLVSSVQQKTADRYKLLRHHLDEYLDSEAAKAISEEDKAWLKSNS